MWAPAFAKALVLVLEAVQPFGKEYDDHEKEKKPTGGDAHDHAHHLELGDHLVTTCAFVPDVVLHIAPGCKTTQQIKKYLRKNKYTLLHFIILPFSVLFQ